MAEETKPVEEVAETVEETVVETPASAEAPADKPAAEETPVEAPAEKAEEKPAKKKAAKVEEKAEEAPAEKAEDKPAEKTEEAPASAEATADKPAEKAEEKTGDKKPSRQKDIFAVIEGDAEEVAKPKRRVKGAKNVPYGIAFIKTSFNNTIVSLTDMRGQVVSWSSAGRCGFKGSRKSTAFAATTVAQEAARGAISHGMNEVEIRVQGPGAGRESAVRAIQSAGLRVSAIKDTTPIPHNGCRPKKQRRV